MLREWNPKSIDDPRKNQANSNSFGFSSNRKFSSRTTSTENNISFEIATNTRSILCASLKIQRGQCRFDSNVHRFVIATLMSTLFGSLLQGSIYVQKMLSNEMNRIDCSLLSVVNADVVKWFCASIVMSSHVRTWISVRGGANIVRRD